MTPTTREELRSELERAFRTLGYRQTIARYGATHLCRFFTPAEIVAIAWTIEEFEERTMYNRRRAIEALVCARI